MKGMRLFMLGGALALALPLLGSAQGGGSNVPPGTTNSGIINVRTLSELQTLQMVIKGEDDKADEAVIVRTVLPKTWTYTEGGREKNSANLDAGIGWYMLLATPPVPNKETDFAYELRVRTSGLTEKLDEFKDAKGNPIVIPAKDRTPEGMLKIYMNTMVREYLAAGYKSTTRAQNIKPVPYGVIPAGDGSREMMLMGSRPAPMYYTPIRFTHPKSGETIYTFTGVIGEKLVSLRFLVAKDQEEYYESTIALILNNTWGLTMEQDTKWAKEMEKKLASQSK